MWVCSSKQLDKNWCLGDSSMCLFIPRNSGFSSLAWDSKWDRKKSLKVNRVNNHYRAQFFFLLVYPIFRFCENSQTSDIFATTRSVVRWTIFWQWMFTYQSLFTWTTSDCYQLQVNYSMWSTLCCCQSNQVGENDIKLLRNRQLRHCMLPENCFAMSSIWWTGLTPKKFELLASYPTSQRKRFSFGQVLHKRRDSMS